MIRPWAPGAVTGLGSLPGTDPAEACRLVFGELPDLPHLPELPDRGPTADLVGRAAALLVDLPAEIVPSGWRFTARPGHELRRGRDLLARDLDAMEEQAEGWNGPLKVQVAGPWTLAASIELPNGHRVVSDRGATRDLAASLAEGIRVHLDEIARRVPGAKLIVQFDEPSLPTVLSGSVRTPSGYGSVRQVDVPEAEQTLADILALAPEGGRVVHCCAPDVPIALLQRAGADAIALDAALLTGVGERTPGKANAHGSLASSLTSGHNDALGEAIETGLALWLGVLPTDAAPDFAAARSSIRRLWSVLGFAESQLPETVVPTPACGLAGTSRDHVRRTLAVLRDVGRDLVDPVEVS